jgi:hypothetical protein
MPKGGKCEIGVISMPWSKYAKAEGAGAQVQLDIGSRLHTLAMRTGAYISRNISSLSQSNIVS